MRFSTCRMSTSPSSTPSRCSRRLLTSLISRMCCFCSSLSGRCAAMASARRPPSSMPDIDVRISGGIFLLSFTYWSNCASNARRIASTSFALPGSPGSGNALRDQIFAAVFHRADLRALRALDQHLHGAVGQLQHLQDRGDRADFVEVLGRGVVLRRLLLRDEQDVLARLHGHVERLDGFGPPDEERNDHVRKDHDVAQRKQRKCGQVGGERRVGGHACLKGLNARGGGLVEEKMGAPRQPVKPPVASRHPFPFGF